MSLTLVEQMPNCLRMPTVFFGGGRCLLEKSYRLLLLGIAIAASPLVSAAPVTALAFSSDGGVLVSNGDRSLEIRSAKDAVVLRRIICDLPKITTLAFSPDGRWLVAGGGEAGVRGEARVLAWPEGKAVHHFTNHTDLVTKVSFDASGGRIAIASSDHSVRVLRMSETGNLVELFPLIGHAGPVLAVAFSPGGKGLVTASADRSLKVWSTEDGRLLRTFSQHTEAIHALAFRPWKAQDAWPVFCASGSDDRTVRVWQPEIGRMVRIVRGHGAAIFALAWSADGSSLFSTGKEGVIRRIDADSDTIEAQWRAHDDWIYALALSPDGTRLASGDWKGAIRLHDPGRDSDPEFRKGP